MEDRAIGESAVEPLDPVEAGVAKMDAISVGGVFRIVFQGESVGRAGLVESEVNFYRAVGCINLKNFAFDLLTEYLGLTFGVADNEGAVYSVGLFHKYFFLAGQVDDACEFNRQRFSVGGGRKEAEQQ